MVEILSTNYVSIFVLGLEVATNDGEDSMVRPIVDVACHGGPIGDSLDMIEHDPRILDIISRLRPPNKINFTTKANFLPFKKEDFVELITLSRKHVLLNTGPVAESF